MNFISWILEKLVKSGKRGSMAFCIIAFVSVGYGLVPMPLNTIVGEALCYLLCIMSIVRLSNCLIASLPKGSAGVNTPPETSGRIQEKMNFSKLKAGI